MPNPQGDQALLQRIAQHPLLVAVGIFATLLAAAVFFVDLSYRATIADLHRKVDDTSKELKAQVEANQQLMKDLSSPRGASASESEGRGEEGSRPAINSYREVVLKLSLDMPIYFWDKQGRLTLKKTYEFLNNGVFEGYLGSEPIRWDLYDDRREEFAFLGSTYFVDLLDVGPDSASLRITPKRIL